LTTKAVIFLPLPAPARRAQDPLPGGELLRPRPRGPPGPGSAGL